MKQIEIPYELYFFEVTPRFYEVQSAWLRQYFNWRIYELNGVVINHNRLAANDKTPDTALIALRLKSRLLGVDRQALERQGLFTSGPSH